MAHTKTAANFQERQKWLRDLWDLCNPKRRNQIGKSVFWGEGDYMLLHYGLVSVGPRPDAGGALRYILPRLDGFPIDTSVWALPCNDIFKLEYQAYL